MLSPTPRLPEAKATEVKVQKGERKMKKTLAEAIRGMQVRSWEVREHSDGKRVVYVRFAPKEPTLTMNVKEG